MRWVVAVTLGEAVGFAIAAAVAVAIAIAAPPAGFALAATVTAGLVEGALLALGQWLGMSTRRPSLVPWVAATAGAAGFAWLLGMTPSTLGLDIADPRVIVAVVVGAVVLLSSIPVVQALVLRRAGAGAWVGASLAGWTVGILWTVAPSPFIDESSPVGLVVTLYAVAGLLMAATVAVMTLPVARRLFGPASSRRGGPSSLVVPPDGAQNPGGGRR